MAKLNKDTTFLSKDGLIEKNLNDEFDKVSSQLAQTDTHVKKVKEEFSPLYLPTWDGASDSLHPSVLYSPTNPIGHYPFWMVNTPLTSGNGYGDRWECPNVFRSVDGITWRVNSPEANPLDDLTPEEIENKGYFSDPCILRVGDTLEVWYRLTPNGANYADTLILRKTTSDGVTWSEREVVFDPKINNGDVGSGWYPRSPQVLYENGKYIMYYSTDTSIERMETTDPTGSVWTNQQTVSYDGVLIWHFTVARNSDGKLHMVGYSANNEEVNYYIGTTDINFAYQKTLLSLDENISLNADRYYQSALCFVNNELFVYATMRSKRTGRWRTVLFKGTSYNDLVPVHGGLEENRKVFMNDVVLGNSKKPNGKKNLMYRVYESDNGLEYYGYGYDLDSNKPILHLLNRDLPIVIADQDTLADNASIAPINKPDYTGQLYQFLKTKKLYSAFGNSAKEDWIEVATMPRLAVRILTGDPIALGAVPHFNGQLALRSDTNEFYVGTGTTANSWICLDVRAQRKNAAFSDGFEILPTHYKIVFNAGTGGTLTNLLGGFEGQEVILFNALTSNITIQSNSQIIPRGKVDRVLSQFEAIKLTKTSTYWSEV